MTIFKAIAWSVTAAGIALATAPVAHAATITGLFNTGTDANNVALVGGDGIVDMHYSIVSSTLPGVVGNQGVTYTNGAYFPDDSNSRWISGDASGLPFVGTTVFRLTFSLAGLDAASAVITGQLGSDNFSRILLNGQDTGFFALDQFLAPTAFTLTGLVDGTNTLDFEVDNRGGPMALRVDELRGVADLAGGVPEPSTWALLVLGFGAAGAGMRSRRGRAALAWA